MSYAIKPRTQEGERAIALAEGLIERFRARADAADRANEICPDNYRDMQGEGVAAAFVPEAVGRGEVLICSTTTERGTDNLHPLTEARRDGDGWSLHGTKYFVTMSPLATHVATNVRIRDEDGDHIANVLLPMDAPGLS